MRRVVIDRSFVDADGVRWIIDFKSGRRDGADAALWLDAQSARHRDQLARYAEALRRIESRPLRIGLWFPAMRAWRELAPSASADASPAAAIV